MTIDKWLEVEKTKEKREALEKKYNSLSEEQVLNLKKRKIQELIRNKSQKKSENNEPLDLINDIIAFKEWLNKRTYIKGDLDKIAIWISNLHKKINLEQEIKSSENINDSRTKLIEDFKKIPLDLLDESIKLAINKKLFRKELTKSDNYYLKKLKTIIEEKLHEETYFKILKKIIEL